MMPAIAVLGCGYWGQNHIKTLKASGHLYAVSDIDMDRAKDIANIYNVIAIEPSKLFSCNNIDAITLALPPQFHAQNALLAIKQNKDVFIEKPISLNPQVTCKLAGSGQMMSGIITPHLVHSKLVG